MSDQTYCDDENIFIHVAQQGSHKLHGGYLATVGEMETLIIFNFSNLNLSGQL